MITPSLVPLPKDEQEHLSSLFGSTGFKILLQVLKGRAQEHAAAALRSAIEGKDYDAKFDPANDSLRQAQGWVNTLEHLQALAKDNTHNTIKLS